MMKLELLRGEYAVARLDVMDAPDAPTLTPAWAAGDFVCITRTADELSIVCESARVPAEVRAERGWRALRVSGTLDFSLTGVLESIARPLAQASLSIFAISTFDTDYVLVRAHALAAAVAALESAGHQVAQ